MSGAKKVARPIARRIGLAAPRGQWWRTKSGPFAPLDRSAEHSCNVCGWGGPDFVGPFHAEMATCPRCGSISRDRFLMHCFVSRTPRRSGLRVLETSPRLGAEYRLMMRRHFRYVASDYDQSAHAGDIRLDLQSIDLPDSSLDVVVTPHVLEHVPHTSRALGEIHRVLTPGGRMYLQIPLLHGITRVPTTPEFHADNTPVFFNFGWDLLGALRSAGFACTALVTEEWFDALTGHTDAPTSNGDGFVVEELVEVARRDLDPANDLTVVADRELSRRLGFLPPYHHVAWECIKADA